MSSFAFSNFVKNLLKENPVHRVDNFDAIPAVNIASPDDIVVTSSKHPLYEVSNVTNLAFLKFNASDQEVSFEMDDGRAIKANELLKVHLSNAYPLNPLETPEHKLKSSGFQYVSANNGWIHIEFSNAPETDRKIIELIAQNHLSLYSSQDVSRVLDWKKGILDSISGMMINPTPSYPIVGVFPSSTLFLNHVIRAIGGEEVAKISLDKKFILAQNLNTFTGLKANISIVTPHRFDSSKLTVQNFINEGMKSLEAKSRLLRNLSDNRLAAEVDLKKMIQSSTNKVRLLALLASR